ncbi:MAG: hypothetical protein ACTS3R_07420 [Inquilinaceae bacterium]
MRILVAWIVVAMAVVLAPVSGQAQQWQPIDASEARLDIAPSAFGTQGIQRSSVTAQGARYERWSTGLDSSRRFFHVVLREAIGLTVIADPLDIPTVAAEAWPAAAGAAFEDPVELITTLGPTRYRRFTQAGIGCAAFITTFGDYRGGYPANTVQGIYCDPGTRTLPQDDVERTLNAITVRR